MLDTAKAVRALLSQGERTLRAMLGSEWLTRGQPVPFVMVPTTSGTGSECTAVAVVQDDRSRLKQEIVSDQFLPDVAVLDPRSTKSLPPRLTAASGMDALTHAIEAYTGRQKNPLSDAYARSAVELIGQNLIAAVREPKKDEYRLAMACASAMAGMAFSNSMVGVAHAIAHALGAVCQLPHGEAVGLLLPKVMRWQMDVQAPRYGELLCAFCGAEYYAEIPYQQRGEKLVEGHRGHPAAPAPEVRHPTDAAGTRGSAAAILSRLCRRRSTTARCWQALSRPAGRMSKTFWKARCSWILQRRRNQKSTVVEAIPQRCFF